jgi:hypothetical protein
MYAFGQYITDLGEREQLATRLINEYYPRGTQHLVTVVAQDPAEPNLAVSVEMRPEAGRKYESAF